MPYFHSADWPSLLRWMASAERSLRIAVEHASGETLEAKRIVHGQTEMTQLDLSVRACQRQRPRDRPAVVILFDNPHRAGLGVGIAGGEREAARASRRQANRLLRLTIGSSTGPVVFDSRSDTNSASGRASVPPRPMNRRAIGLVLGWRTPTRPRPART